MSKDAYYFSHDSNARHDPNISEMRSDYKSEGYGWYWILIEMMREQEDFKLKLCKCNAFAMQLQCTMEASKKFIEDCIKKYELFDSDGEYFWSESLLRRMEMVAEKSQKARSAAYSRWSENGDANAMQTQCKRNAIKESKVNKNSTPSTEAEKIYISLFEQKYGQRPEISFARDRKILNSIIDNRGLPKTIDLLTAYFKSDDKFIVGSGHSLPVFKSSINQLLAEVNRPRRPEERKL